MIAAYSPDCRLPLLGEMPTETSSLSKRLPKKLKQNARKKSSFSFALQNVPMIVIPRETARK
jgi:hypothetical protein